MSISMNCRVLFVLAAGLTLVSAAALKEWTFVNYYATNNSLEAYTFRDVDKWTSSPKITGTVTSQWLLDTTTQGAYRVSMDGSTWNAPPGLVFTHVTHPNMSDPTVLAAHIKRVVKDYPAKNYAFWYSGHSRGWYVIPEMIDEGADDEVDIWLSVTSIKKALAASGVKFELVTFDSCVMSMVETAYELRDVSKYMLAYETWGPWEGFMSPETVDTFQNTKIAVLEKLKMVADNFIKRNSPAEAGANLETADAVVADLSAVGALGQFILSLKLVQSDFRYSNQTRNRVDYGTRDLYDVIINLPPARLSSAQRQEFNRLFNAVVVYYVQNDGVPQNLKNGEPGSALYNPYHHGLSVLKSLVQWPAEAPAYRELDLQPVAQPKPKPTPPGASAIAMRAADGDDDDDDDEPVPAGRNLPPRPVRRRYAAAGRGRNAARPRQQSNRRDQIERSEEAREAANVPAVWIEANAAENTPSSEPAIAVVAPPALIMPLVVFLCIAAASAFAVYKYKYPTAAAGYESIPEATVQLEANPLAAAAAH